MQTTQVHHSHSPVVNHQNGCQLQVHGTVILDAFLSELTNLLHAESGQRADVHGVDFGREGWTLNTRFASPHNLHELLSSIERTLKQYDIPTDDVTVSIEEESFPLNDLL